MSSKYEQVLHIISQVPCYRKELGLLIITCETLHMFQGNGNLFSNNFMVKYTQKETIYFPLP